MEHSLVCIAGGSGSGKSTLAISLYKKYPDLITIVGLDDYYKSAEEAPRYEKGINWETPNALRFDDLARDIEALLSGKTIKVRSKHELYNPDYRPSLRNKLEVELMPKRIILLEGYLALLDPRIRNLMAFGLFLDMPIEKSVLRRSENKVRQSDEYFNEVLFPSHEAIVAPTIKYADIMLDSAEISAARILLMTENMLQVRKLLPE